ncbi:MAG: tripartite tricarboxylate transporter TctB family protein [Pseudomonadota bacterium]
MERLNCNHKDLWTGVLFSAAGIAAIVFVREHEMGSATSMGPAYFPTILGMLQILIGLVLVARSFLRSGLPIGRLVLGKMALVLGAILLFGLLLRGMGLIVAIIVIVVISAYASEKFRWLSALGLAVGIAIGSAIVFSVLLGIPVPLIGTWIETWMGV